MPVVMIDTHDDAIGAAEAGRRLIVAEPVYATGMGGGRPIPIPPGTRATIARPAVRGDLDVLVSHGGGRYRLRIARAYWRNLDLEPGP